MSSTLAPETISECNPITEKDVISTLDSLGLKPNPKDVEDFTSLLTGIWEVWDKVSEMEDYIPEVDEERFPRENVHRPEGEANAENAWAWKCEIKDATDKSKGGLLEGKTVNLKVSKKSTLIGFYTVL
jgi:amidase